MRKYKCFACGNAWRIIFDEETPGTKQACPECKSLNVHSKDDKPGWIRDSRGTSLGRDKGFQGGQPQDIAAEDPT